MELTTVQVVLIGLIATVLAQGVKLIRAWFKKDTSKAAVSGIAYLISLVFAFFALGLQTPPEGGWTFMAALDLVINQSASVLGFATLVYNLLLDKVFTALQWTKEKVLLLRG